MNSNYIQDSFLHTSNYVSFLRKKNDILMAIMTNPENVFTSWGGGGGYSLIWVIQVCATGQGGQGMVFWPHCPKQGIQFDLPLS